MTAAPAAPFASLSAVAAATALPGLGFLDDAVNGRIVLPTIPRVVRRLIVELRRGDASLHGLATELAHDPVLSARVLRLANSSFYSGRRSLASVQDAVAVIGTRALQTLVIACGVLSAFVEVPGVNLREFWLDAVVTGAAAHCLAQQLALDADVAHAAGLLLGTGHLILCQAHPLIAAAQFTRYRNLRGAALAARELEIFGIAHPAVSALWVDRLGFPEAVVQAIEHSLDEAPAEPTGSLALLVGGASALAAGICDGESVAQAVARIDPVLLQHPKLQTFLEGPDFADRFAQMKDLPSLA